MNKKIRSNHELCHMPPSNSRLGRNSCSPPWTRLCAVLCFFCIAQSYNCEVLADNSANSQSPSAKVTNPRTAPIGLLAPLGFLNLAAIREFELKEGVRVRVDFLTSGSEIETRVRSNPFAWDIVVADLAKLQQMQDAKLIQSIEPYLTPQNSELLQSLKTLEDFPWSKHVVPLTLDSMGVVWNDKRVKLNDADLSFTWLLGTAKLSQLKGRLFYKGPKELAFLLGLLQSGALENKDGKSVKISDLSAESLLAGQEWAARFLEVKLPIEENLWSSLMKGQGLYSIIWASEFARLKSLYPALKFSIPKKQSLFEIHGAALAMESRNPKLAMQLLETFIAKKNAIAAGNGTKPFDFSHATEVGLQGRLISGLLPISKDLVQKHLSGPAFSP